MRYFLFLLATILLVSCQDSTDKGIDDLPDANDDATFTAAPAPTPQAAPESSTADAPDKAVTVTSVEPSTTPTPAPTAKPTPKRTESAATPAPERNTAPETSAPTPTPSTPKAQPSTPAAPSTPASTTKPPEATPAAAPDHSTWTQLLRKYVKGRTVNYKGMASERAKLDRYLDALSSNPPQSNWSRNEKLAYWINAYNAYTVQLILDNYPLKSIRDLKGGKPWDDKFITIGGKRYSLNDIEHQTIRKQFDEPRIHFAVNCASVSCPKLLDEAYTADKLEQQLEAQTRDYINSRFNKVTKNSLQLSSIFDWYGEDFDDVADFVDQYSDVNVSNSAKITFMDYDWGLNE